MSVPKPGRPAGRCPTAPEAAGPGVPWASDPHSGALISTLSVRLQPAPADRGTVVTLHAHLAPPGGALGHAAAGSFHALLPHGLLETTLRFFKSLAETGEIPTTERQSAVRTDKP